MSKYSEKKQRRALERIEAAMEGFAAGTYGGGELGESEDVPSCAPPQNPVSAACGSGSTHGLLSVAVGATPVGADGKTKKPKNAPPPKKRLTPQEQSERDKAIADKEREAFNRHMERVVLKHITSVAKNLHEISTLIDGTVCPIANAKSAARRGELRGELYAICGLFDSFNARFKECVIRTEMLVTKLEMPK